MGLITFEDYAGNRVEINPALVQSVTTYHHYDHNLDVPDKFMHKNGDDLDEVNPVHREAVDKLRTSDRTIITYPNGGVVVKGTLDEVKKALETSPTTTASKR